MFTLILLHVLEMVMREQNVTGALLPIHLAQTAIYAVIMAGVGYYTYARAKAEEGYNEEILSKKIPALVVPFMIMNIIYVFLYAGVWGISEARIRILLDFCTGFLGVTLINGAGFVVIELIICLLLFYFAPKKIKTDGGIIGFLLVMSGLIMTLGIYLGDDKSYVGGHWFFGGKWCEILLFFTLGVILAKVRGAKPKKIRIGLGYEMLLCFDLFLQYFFFRWDFPVFVYFLIIPAATLLAAYLLHLASEYLMDRWNYFVEKRKDADAPFEVKFRLKGMMKNIRKVGIFYVLLAGVVIFLSYKEWELINIVPGKNYELEAVGLQNAKVGDEVLFGYCDRDFMETGKEQIPWLVVEESEDMLLLVSKDVLYGKAFNTHYEEVTWETSSINRWLNTEFVKEAFNEYESPHLVQGKGRGEYLFLLTKAEAENYLGKNLAGIATPMAIRHGVNVNPRSGSSWWWVIDSGETGIRAQTVSQNGSFNEKGENVSVASGGVRPAVWVRRTK